MNADVKVTNEQARRWNKNEMTLAAYAARKHIPLGGTFELTPRCTLRCGMCYVRLDKEQMDKIGRELTAGEWIALAEEAIQAGTLNLLITGGEPLIRGDFEEIFTALTKMGFIITLNTNATLITPEIVRLFSKYPPTATSVTLYGATPETYGKVCGDADGFSKTIRGLELLSKLPTNLEIRTTFIKDNMQELDQLRIIANRYTKRYAINTNVFKPVRGAKSDVEACRMSPRQMIEVSTANTEYYRELNRNDEVPVDDLSELEEEKEYGFDLPPAGLYCLASKSSYWITWDGKMLPCGCFSAPYTTPLKEGFSSAWERLPGLLNDVTTPSECKSCEYNNGSCPNCLAKLQAETGSFDKLSPYICAIAQERTRAFGL
jgi:radical SAM protein with 4Fe4S-binding SPASM domain